MRPSLLGGRVQREKFEDFSSAESGERVRNVQTKWKKISRDYSKQKKEKEWEEKLEIVKHTEKKEEGKK